MSGINGYPHPDGEAWGKPLPPSGGGGGARGGCLPLVAVAAVLAIVGWLS